MEYKHFDHVFAILSDRLLANHTAGISQRATEMSGGKFLAQHGRSPNFENCWRRADDAVVHSADRRCVARRWSGKSFGGVVSGGGVGCFFDRQLFKTAGKLPHRGGL